MFTKWLTKIVSRIPLRLAVASLLLMIIIYMPPFDFPILERDVRLNGNSEIFIRRLLIYRTTRRIPTWSRHCDTDVAMRSPNPTLNFALSTASSRVPESNTIFHMFRNCRIEIRRSRTPCFTVFIITAESCRFSARRAQKGSIDSRYSRSVGAIYLNITSDQLAIN